MSLSRNCLKCDCDCSIFINDGERYLKCPSCDYVFKELLNGEIYIEKEIDEDSFEHGTVIVKGSDSAMNICDDDEYLVFEDGQLVEVIHEMWVVWIQDEWESGV